MRGAAAGGRAGEAYFGEAFLDGRGALHLGYRLAVRFVQWVSISGAASPGAGHWRLALPLFVLLDVGTWLVLGADDRFGLTWRLPLDAVDITFWSLSPMPRDHLYDTAVLIGIPLSVEAGFRIGLAALVVPIAGLAVTSPARLLVGYPAYPRTYGWLVLGVGMGMGAFTYCGRLHEQAMRERHRRRAADAGRAFLFGQNAVAMGADSIVDAIEGVVPVLGRPPRGSALWQLAGGWKARLAMNTAAQATYLQVALLRWESAHNRHPDLSTRVELHMGEGIGTILLSGRQVAALQALLDRCNLRGLVRVVLPDQSGAARTLGSSLHLDVGGRQLRLPADRAVMVRPVDIAPVAYGLVAAELLPLLPPNRGGLPPAVVGAGIILCGGAAWWSHRRLRSSGLQARPMILTGAIVVAVVLTVLTGPLLTEPVDRYGSTVYIGLGTLLLGVLGGMYWSGLERRRKTMLAAAIIFVSGLSLVATAGPLDIRSFLCNVVLSLAPMPYCCHTSGALGRATRRDSEAAAEEDERETQAAFSRGQESVLELVRMARDDARSQLAVVAPRLEPDLVALVTHRLEEVDRRLARIAA